MLWNISQQCNTKEIKINHVNEMDIFRHNREGNTDKYSDYNNK